MFTRPAATPVTSPVELMPAIAGLPDVHVPPPLVFVSIVVPPIHTAAVPPMFDGSAFTVNDDVRRQPVGSV